MLQKNHHPPQQPRLAKLRKMAHKSASSHAILDADSRKQKAEKIARVLKQKVDLSQARLLDIGTGAGYIAQHLASQAATVTSVDLVDERRVVSGYTFVRVHDESMPFETASFDVVISNHVIEHVHDQQRHVSEVLRVLKPRGIVYLATPNRNWLIDPHYRLPFINWMPRPVATAYLRALKAQTWDIRPVTVRRLRQYTNEQQLESVVVDIIKNPKQYHLDTLKPLHPLTKRLPRPILQLASHLSPTILLTITKTADC